VVRSHCSRVRKVAWCWKPTATCEVVSSKSRTKLSPAFSSLKSVPSRGRRTWKGGGVEVRSSLRRGPKMFGSSPNVSLSNGLTSGDDDMVGGAVAGRVGQCEYNALVFNSYSDYNG